MTWREVSKAEFFDTVERLNVHPKIQNPEKYPYTSLWKTPAGVALGKTEGLSRGGYCYFVPAEGGDHGPS